MTVALKFKDSEKTSKYANILEQSGFEFYQFIESFIRVADLKIVGTNPRIENIELINNDSKCCNIRLEDLSYFEVEN